LSKYLYPGKLSGVLISDLITDYSTFYFLILHAGRSWWLQWI